MTSVQAFDEMFSQFVKELRTTYPDFAKLREFKLEENYNALEYFNYSTENYSQYIPQRNKLFFSKRNKFSRDLDLIGIVKIANPESKDAIWKFLNTLYVLSQSISMIPPEMLQMIERVSEQCAGQFKGDSNDQEKIENLMLGVQSMMSSMNKS
jgi:hypothetical protein